MSNMSYAMFENTLSDLRDCETRLYEIDNLSGMSGREKEAAKTLINICKKIANDFGHLA